MSWYIYFMIGLFAVSFASGVVQKYRRSNHHDWSLLNLITVFFGVFGALAFMALLPFVVALHFGWVHFAWGALVSVVLFDLWRKSFR